MIRDSARTRSGITLVEILISILIMGVGVISIATLFPLGLIRLRNAQRLTRSAYLVESAIADLGARNLMARDKFYPYNYFYYTKTSGYFNPLYMDTGFYGADWGPDGYGNAAGANRYIQVPGSTQVIGAGLPVAYDPLWRAVTGSYPDPVGTTTPECRFGSGIGAVRSEGTTPPVPAHAHGLQRVTSYQTVPSATATVAQAAHNYLTVLGIFISPEDVLLQEKSGQYPDPLDPLNSKVVSPSTVVPDMTDVVGPAPTSSSPVLDWRYTWFFTGQQTDQGSNSVEGEVVICENRPFAVDVLDSSKYPAAGSYQVSGETVVEAVWGYSSSPGTMLSSTQGYGSLSSSRSVLIRWPNTKPDPDVRVGGYIADVTYERVDATARSHYGVTTSGGAMTVNGFYPAQRCHWYQVAKKSEVSDDPLVSGFRQMTVWTTTPLKALTLLTFSAGKPSVAAHVEAALIMPSVVGVFPRTIPTRLTTP